MRNDQTFTAIHRQIIRRSPSDVSHLKWPKIETKKRDKLEDENLFFGCAISTMFVWLFECISGCHDQNQIEFLLWKYFSPVPKDI